MQPTSSLRRDFVRFAALLLFLALPACDRSEPEPAAPQPPSRQSFQCCADPVEMAVVDAYLAVGDGLAADRLDEAASASLQEALSELSELYHGAEALLAVVEASAALADAATGGDLAAGRSAYQTLSDLLIERLISRRGGSKDLAVTSRRRSKGQWLQIGNEPRSPQGDPRGEVNWGTLEQVLAWDHHQGVPEEHKSPEDCAPTPSNPDPCPQGR